MSKNVLIVASNYGLWAEELQGPWDALNAAGNKLTLATYLGKKPLPFLFSEDPDFVDPAQNVRVNTPEVVARVKELLGNGAWDNPIKVADANMDDYDSLVLVGGPGAPLDITGNPAVHRLAEKAFADGKIIGAMCYAIGALVWARYPDNHGKSVLWGKTVVAHPRMGLHRRPALPPRRHDRGQPGHQPAHAGLRLPAGRHRRGRRRSGRQGGLRPDHEPRLPERHLRPPVRHRALGGVLGSLRRQARPRPGQVAK